MPIMNSLVLLFLCLLPCIVLSAEYGEICDPAVSSSCYANDGLSCSLNGTSVFTCGCTLPDQMEFDPIRQRCKFKTGFLCETTVNGTTYTHECIDEHAECDSRSGNVCRCQQFYGNVEGRCLPSHGSECRENSECNEGTLCQVGHCNCPSIGSQVFDRNRGRCFSLSGVSCIPGEGESGSDVISCDPNSSSCVPDPTSPTNFSCSCNESLGYVADYSLKCSRSFEQSCGIREGQGYEATECSEYSGLVCYNGKCVCKYGDNQQWDEGRKACVSLEGGPCGMYSEFQFDFCHEGLECVMDPSGPQDEGVCREIVQ